MVQVEVPHVPSPRTHERRVEEPLVEPERARDAFAEPLFEGALRIGGLGEIDLRDGESKRRKDTAAGTFRRLLDDRTKRVGPVEHRLKRGIEARAVEDAVDGEGEGHVIAGAARIELPAHPQPQLHPGERPCLPLCLAVHVRTNRFRRCPVIHPSFRLG